MKNLLLSLAITSLLSVSAYAINAKEMVHHTHGEHAAMSSLNLSDQQKQDIKQIHREAQQDLSVYQGEGKQRRDSMRALMQADVWDEVAVRAAIEEQMEAKLESKLIHARSKNKVFNQLTAEQQAQFMEHRLAKKQSKGERKGKRKGKNPENKIQRLVKALDLNSEQETQLQSMLQSNKAQRDENKAQVQALKAELSSIVQASTFDEEAWLTVHANNKQSMLEMAVNKAKSRFDMLSVLNSEQREKFTKIMQKSKEGKMNKHRGKRDSKRHGE